MSLDPFWNRPALRELYEPLVGKSMLELGDKLDGGEDRVYKYWFEALGFRHVSVDMNGLHGALPLDLTKPLNLGTFDMICNVGTSEHVSETDWDGQVQCWRNMLAAMHIGSVLICDTPKGPRGWKLHGIWHPTMAFYGELARRNGLEIERLLENDWRPGHGSRRVVSARMVKVKDVLFVMPSREHMFVNL